MATHAKSVIGKIATTGILVLGVGTAGFFGRGLWDSHRISHTTMPGGAAAKAQPKILYYWDPMLGPSSKSDKPGISAMGMDLIPVYEGQQSDSATVKVDPAMVQNMGIQTAIVGSGTLQKTLRTVGYLETPETGMYDITLKIGGYIDKLYADRTGMLVKKGDPLFDLYSPDLVVAEDELIAARKSVEALKRAGPEIQKQAADLFAVARRKLQLWDLTDPEIDAIAGMDQAPKDFTVRSPAEGQVQEKAIVQGSSVQAGMKLLRIEDQRTLWLEAQVYEGQLPLVKLGETATATLDAMPGKTFSGAIVFVDPSLNADTRTTNVRVALENKDLSLRPGMYASVRIQAAPVDDALLVPAMAVLDTGTEKVVFVQDDAGHFSPRTITTGISGDGGATQVLSGLAAGETIVTSGQFLLDVESRTQEAFAKMQAPPASALAQTLPATAPAAAVPAQAPSGETDEVVSAYLAVAAYLEQDHADNKPADLAGVVRCSGALEVSASAPENRKAAGAVKDAATAMAGDSLEVQHKSFEKVGAALLELLRHDPPSAKVGGTLYVMNCVMEKAQWLQLTATIDNPFIPAMRTCGEVAEKWPLKPVE